MKITNITPWDTEGLTALVTAMGDSLPNLEKVSFVNHQAKPGVARKNQKIYRGSEPYNWGAKPKDEAVVTELCLELLSPKRVKARTSTLDRLAFVTDLEPHQVPLPVSVIENIVHALHQAAKKQTVDRYHRRQHINGTCKCNKTLPETPIIAGDTKARVRPPVTMAQLRQKQSYAENAVAYAEDELKKAHEALDKAISKIDRKKEQDCKEQNKTVRSRTRL